jgi:preprotein translocase subunit SecD
MIAALVVLIIIMLASVIGSDLTHPGSWSKNFKIGLGLDLSSGTTVTLKAVTPNSSKPPSQTAMTEARTIMDDRVSGAGFTGAVVQQEGPNIITVSVPGKGAQQVENLVGRTALLRFRQVLLVAPNLTTSTATPTPTPSASASKPAAKSSKTAKATPTPTASASASPSPAASPTASPSATPALSTTADGQGDAAALSPAVKALFNKLNCNDADWQQKIYGTNSQAWDNVNNQIVACYQGEKYALDKSTVTGEMLKSASGSLNTNGTWQVNLNFNGTGAKAFGTLSSNMYAKYAGSATNPQNNFAIVLDGAPVSVAYIAQPINDGTGQITGSFTENQANYLANVLSYGHLPLSFKNESTQAISAQLGSAQLQAGLAAGAVGLLLVVLYSFLYYRGLGIVSVSSLAIAAVLALLSVTLLSKYSGFTLNLAGVAGLIVAIGITADSFVVFFERLRDEVREGRSLRPAVERGWQRARRTILVSDTVSFLAALMLWYFSIDQVKSFAFTLGLTTVIDVIVVFLFTHPMITILARTKFYGDGHPLSGLDPARLGARSPWRGSRRTPVRPSTDNASATATGQPSRTTPKEA